MTINNTHPMTENLSKIPTTELEQKLNDLRKKYLSATNPQIKNQIFYFLTDYQEELKLRYAQEQAELQKNSDSDLDNLINID